ncbi:MAG: EVE domain-containing protein, partial [Planctomycetota bacterium]
RPERLTNAIMDAAPVNEMGVVCLFTDWARKHQVRIDTVRAAFPDCIAWVKAGGQEQQVRIEFEFRSRNFRTHKHDPAGCDWIVCWEHDWADCPESLRVLELRKEYGLGFNVWIQPVSNDTEDRYSTYLSETETECNWTVASQAHEGDLVLFYHSTPRKEIADIFRISGPLMMDGDEDRGVSWNKRKRDWFADLVRVARLESPVTLMHMKKHRALKDAGWIRNNLISRAKVTVDWVFLRELVIERNPELEASLPLADGTMAQKPKKKSSE